RQIRAFTKRPIVITETGAVDFDGHKAAWIQEMFRQLPQNPDIIGVIWYESRKAKQADWRVSVSTAASAAFKAGMNDPRYDVQWTLNSQALRSLDAQGAAAPSSPPPTKTPANTATKTPTTRPPTRASTSARAG
ncbi:MAG: hypothetical protein HOV68_27210, partial [Streptomycetaceae bacterium]|nr:hypothetical protein [Streptomycetaceae bacterium]